MNVWARPRGCWWEKKNRCVCIFYSLLCSLNGLFEMGHRRLCVGGQWAATLILIQPQVSFWGYIGGCLEKWVLAWPQSSSSHMDSKLLLRAAGLSSASRGRQPLGDPLHSRISLHACIHFGWNFTVAVLEGVGVGNELTPPGGPDPMSLYPICR